MANGKWQMANGKWKMENLSRAGEPYPEERRSVNPRSTWGWPVKAEELQLIR
jgi:hypothetical protein